MTKRGQGLDHSWRGALELLEHADMEDVMNTSARRQR
jgi:hypothetical protein